MDRAAELDESPLKVRLIGLVKNFDELDWAMGFPEHSLFLNGVECVFGGRGPQDVLAVLGGARADYPARVRRGGVWVWHTEAMMPKEMNSSFDLVFSHLNRPDDDRFVVAPPVLNWWVGKSFDELATMEPPRKEFAASAISSMKTHIPGHLLRNDFIAALEQELPEVHVFGRGRARPLLDKWDGVAPYRYTVVIENSSTPDYWTEKLADAFMGFSVPFYYGAPNVGDYFPPESYIWLPIDEPDRAIEIIRQTLATDDWESRLSAVRDARKIILNRWCLAEQVTRAVREREAQLRAAPFVEVKVLGRRVWEGGWIRQAGLWENLRVHSRKIFRSAVTAIGKILAKKPRNFW